MFDRAKQINRLRPRSQRAAGCPLEVVIVGSQFQVGEFPEVRVHLASGSLADEEATAFLRDKRNESARRGADRPAAAGQFKYAALLISGAMLRDRTDAAPGFPGCADERAEFHERLVEMGAGAWCVMRDA